MPVAAAAASQPFKFASFSIVNQVFFQSSLSLGLVNLKPLVPGHVLVIPKRVVPRFRDLTPQEVTDLFASTHQIAAVLEKEYKAHALNLAIQDGVAAGQSVPHVHVHLIPRITGDFEPTDELYNALEDVDLAQDYLSSLAAASRHRPTRAERKARERDVFGVDNEDRQPRSKKDMKQEAMRLSELFPVECRGMFEEEPEERL
ncbi:Dinucleoside triphosphate hydrolase [Microbotryomycetes sp. JL221]|nr:Dinucleoside triphosphate hydrolase [Microbotryomycetes sp. JL221]